MRHNNSNRKQILKCVMLSSYLVILSTFHPRSPERETEIDKSSGQTKEQISTDLNSSTSNPLQENLFNENQLFNNFNSRPFIPVGSFNTDQCYLSKIETAEIEEEIIEQIEINIPEIPSITECTKDCSELILAEIELSSEQLEEIENKTEIAVAYEYPEVEEIATEGVTVDSSNEDPELVAVVEYNENEVIEVEAQVEVTREELPVLAKQQESQNTERMYHPVDWEGGVLTAHKGVNRGPSGKETYYNLPMDGIVTMMHNLGYEGEHWIREDGVHMLGEYVMVAANLNLRPRGSLIETSLGMGIVADTGGFAKHNPTQLDIATTW